MDSARGRTDPKQLKDIHIRVPEDALYVTRGLLLRESVSVSDVFRELLNQVIHDKRLFEKIVHIVKVKKASSAISAFSADVRNNKYLHKEHERKRLEAPDSETAEFLYSMIEQDLLNSSTKEDNE